MIAFSLLSTSTTKRIGQKRVSMMSQDRFQLCKVLTSMGGALQAAKMINGLEETRGLGALNSLKDEVCVEDFNTPSKKMAYYTLDNKI